MEPSCKTKRWFTPHSSFPCARKIQVGCMRRTPKRGRSGAHGNNTRFFMYRSLKLMIGITSQRPLSNICAETARSPSYHLPTTNTNYGGWQKLPWAPFVAAFQATRYARKYPRLPRNPPPALHRFHNICAPTRGRSQRL